MTSSEYLAPYAEEMGMDTVNVAQLKAQAETNDFI
jgi:hypothetical protein